MTDVQETPEIPILLVFEDGTFVAVQPSLLIKESTVFKAQLNSPWQKRKPDDLEEQRIIGDIVKQKGNDIMNFQSKMIPIKNFKGRAAKMVIDWMMGFDELLSSCQDFSVLAEMLVFADFYDIQRGLRAVMNQIGALDIDADNLITAVAAVRRLENMPIGNDLATQLESRSILFVYKNFKDPMSISRFVTENSDNLDLVVRFLSKFQERCGCLFNKTGNTGRSANNCDNGGCCP